MTPLINILIRTHRPELLKRSVQSIVDSGYENYDISYFNDLGGAVGYIDSKGHKNELLTHRPTPFFYNIFCNYFLEYLTDGWFLFLDDDDILIPGALSKIAPQLTDPDQPIICQMLRNGQPKPADIYIDKGAIIKGRIGMPCMVIHSKWKDAYTFEAVEDADYRWIKAISEILKPKFVKIPVVDAGRRSHGQ